MHDGDTEIRQRDPGITRADRRVVPLANLAEKNVGQDGTGEAKLASEVRNVVGSDHRAQGQGYVNDVAERIARLGKLDVGECRVGAAEIQNAVDHILDTAAGADAVVLD